MDLGDGRRLEEGHGFDFLVTELTEPRLQKLKTHLSHARQHRKIPAEQRWIMYSLYWARIEVSTIEKLRWGDIDFDGQSIEVDGASVGIPEACLSELKELRGEGDVCLRDRILPALPDNLTQHDIQHLLNLDCQAAQI